MAAAGLKRVILGRSLATSKQEHQLLPKFLALPVFSSDPLSSVAYATEEMMLVLVAAGASALRLKLPIALAIAAMVYLTTLVGFVRCLAGCPVADTSNLPLTPVAGLTLFLLLRAFASGATALTGVEAIADGVQAFRRPQARNAATTLAIMGF